MGSRPCKSSELLRARGKALAALLTEGALSPFDRYIPKDFMTYEYNKNEQREAYWGTLGSSGSAHTNNVINSIENNTKRD
jgi:hypothetical protein